MAQEVNDIIIRARLEGAGSVSSGISKMAADAEKSALKISNAFDNSFASLRKLAGFVKSPNGSYVNRTTSNPVWKSPHLFNIGTRRLGFGMKVDNLGLANLSRDFIKLQESMASQLKFFADIQRELIKNSFFSNRNLRSSSFWKWNQDTKINTPLLGYNSSTSSWTQDDISAFEDMRNAKKRNEHLDRLRAKRKQYEWFFNMPEGADKDAARRRIFEDANATIYDPRFAAFQKMNFGGDKYSQSNTHWSWWQKVYKNIASLGNSKFAKSIDGTLKLFSRLSMAMWGFTKAIHVAIRAIGYLRSIAREHFYIGKLSEASALGGISGGSRLFPYMQQLKRLGGDAASASAHAAGYANDLGMLGFGGNGGRMMEAASLFGVNLHGSGRHGFATYEEWMRNIAARMPHLSPESQIALKNVAGLSNEQFFAVRRGPESFERHLLYSQTALERFNKFHKSILPSFITGDSFEGRDGRFHQEVSMEWWESWGTFKDSIDELTGVIGDALLPWLSMIMNVISSLVQVLNILLAPITKLLGFIAKFVNEKVFGLGELISSTPPSRMSPNDYYRIENAQPMYNINIGTINQAELGLSPNASIEEIANAYGNFFGHVVSGIGANSRRA